MVKGATELGNAKMSTNYWIMYYNITIETQENSFFNKKKFIHCGDGEEARIPKPIGDADEIQFLIPLGMGRVMSKYMGVENGDGEGKTRPHPAPLPCLDSSDSVIEKQVFLNLIQMFHP